ncbi:MAG: DinB family protein [Bacteroidota bacterium]
METLLQTQYNGVKSARQALLSYCGSMDSVALLKPVPAFNNSSISSLLVHTANTYLHWLVFVDGETPVNYFKEDDIEGITDIQSIYRQVDAAVNNFLTKYADDYQQVCNKKLPARDKTIAVTPLELFTHAITHEFHHKGQILTMSRQLGYTPVDTDVIRT